LYNGLSPEASLADGPDPIKFLYWANHIFTLAGFVVRNGKEDFKPHPHVASSLVQRAQRVFARFKSSAARSKSLG